MGHFVVTNVPCEILLKDTISERIAEFVDDSIETRFGGVRLPTAIKYTHEVITNLSNFVAVEINETHTFDGNNFGVIALPISVIFDCGDHLLFDLTHEREEKGLGLWWGRLPSTSIQYTILGVVPILCATYPTAHRRPPPKCKELRGELVLTKRLQFHNLRFTFINPD